MQSKMIEHLQKKAEIHLTSFLSEYAFDGSIGEGAYGVVRRAHRKSDPKECVAIKQFKNHQTAVQANEGIALTICREIAILRELNHENILKCQDVYVDFNNDNSLFMVFNYCEYDLEKMLKEHKDSIMSERSSMNPQLIKNIMYQLLKGMEYLHNNWIMHRDLKPANILIEKGTVKLGDFGLARIFQNPLKPLGDDGTVVTLWYRAPELILGAKHYTPAVDMWSVGCIFYELFTTDPLFRGEELNGEGNPFQRDQLRRIYTIMGTPTLEDWPTMKDCLHYEMTKNWENFSPQLSNKCKNYIQENSKAFDLLKKLLTIDPAKRISAEEALNHDYFKDHPKPNSGNVFEGDNFRYPEHKVATKDDKSISQGKRLYQGNHYPDNKRRREK